MPVSKTVSTGLLLTLAASLIGLVSCNSTTVRADEKTTKGPKAAPDFALKDADGKTVHLSDYKGKVVVLDFWATWCGPCKIEIPWFMEFEQQYKGKGFAVLGVSMDDDGWTAVKPYVAKMKMNYRIVLGNDKVGELYGGVDSLPTTFLIDRQGRIASTHIGLTGGKEDFQNEIVRLLQKPVTSVRGPARGILASLVRPN